MKFEEVTGEVMKLSPYIPESDAAITQITTSFKPIEYILDERNKVHTTYTSNQFTLTPTEEGTKFTFQVNPDKHWEDYSSHNTTRNEILKNLSEISFYEGKEKLTAANSNDRFIPSFEVLDSSKFKDSTFYIQRAGEYSLVFTNYSEEGKPTLHQIKIEN